MTTYNWELKEKIYYYSEPIPESGCWIWIGGITKNGYGRIRINDKHEFAHRTSYKLFNGSIPDGLLVCHKCDVPSCINPKHLFLGTHKDNIKDSINKNRHFNLRKEYCKNGHEFNLENTYIYYSLKRQPRRNCRQCGKENAKKYRGELNE